MPRTAKAFFAVLQANLACQMFVRQCQQASSQKNTDQTEIQTKTERHNDREIERYRQTDRDRQS